MIILGLLSLSLSVSLFWFFKPAIWHQFSPSYVLGDITAFTESFDTVLDIPSSFTLNEYTFHFQKCVFNKESNQLEFHFGEGIVAIALSGGGQTYLKLSLQDHLIINRIELNLSTGDCQNIEFALLHY